MSHSRLHSPSLFATLRDHPKEKLKEKDTSISRLLDISLPWPSSRSSSRQSPTTSRSNSRTDSASGSISRVGTASRTGPPNDGYFMGTDKASTTELCAHARSHALHARSKSQPRLRTSHGVVTRTHAMGKGRKLSTVQGSPIVRTLKSIDSEAETSYTEGLGAHDQAHEMDTYNNMLSPKKLVSLRSVSSLRRPRGPRQPSPRSTTGTSPSASGKEHGRPLVQPAFATATARNVSPVHSALFPPTPSTPQTTASAVPAQTSAAKQLSGKPARSRSRARVLADLTGFARNVDLSAHGVGMGKNRPGKVKGARARDNGSNKVKSNLSENASPVAPHARGRGITAAKKVEDKENIGTRVISSTGVHANRTRGLGDKENATAPFGSPELYNENHSQSRSLSLFQPQAKSTPKDRDESAVSAVDSLAVLANLSTATNMTKGSVRDRMIDWERERARLREMNRASTVLSGSRSGSSSASTSTSSTADVDSDSELEVEAEAIAEANVTVLKPNPRPAEPETKIKDIPMRTIELARTRSAQTTHTTTTVVSSASGLAASTLTGGSGGGEKGEIEVAKLGVRAPAQILTSRNGSLSAVALNQTLGQVKETRCSEDDVKTVEDNGLPKDVRRTSESALSGFKHSVKASIDKGVRMYKSSTLAQLTGRTTPVWCPSPEPVPLDFESRRSAEGRFSWEDIRPEEEIALDRMNLWIQNVEKVVEETRQNFASTSVLQPTALPLVPVSRSSSQNPSNNLYASQSTSHTTRSARLPRRHLAANQIFAELSNPDAPLSPASQDKSMSFSYIDMPESSCPVLPTLSVLAQTPPRQRRATISTRSPALETSKAGDNSMFDLGTPSKKREKSRSIGNLDRHIRDVAKLELELNTDTVSKPSTQRLSAVLDRSLFVATPIAPKFVDHSGDDLTASPFHVEPYPQRKSGDQSVPPSPERRRLEGVYDRFLMATTGVKRVGKGYQSDNFKPVQSFVAATTPGDTSKASSSQSRTFGVFGSSKRQMPPPVSSDDIWRQSSSIDELGFGTCGAGIVPVTSRPVCKDDSKNTAALVRRAIRAIVPGKTISRRLSRTLIA
ncbi:hypothetical protein J3A83DRAFT_166776 [Scleroderma citrinum]